VRRARHRFESVQVAPLSWRHHPMVCAVVPEVAFWREDGVRRCKMLGRQSQMSKAEAETVLSAILREVSSGTGIPALC
jgi:hypothetical protein